MIIISNGKDFIKINSSELKYENNKYKYFNGNENNDVILAFIRNNKGFLKIQKRLASADGYDGDILKEYNNLDINSNKILLNDNDYKEISCFITNINKIDNIRESMVIDIYSNLIAYECYKWYLFDIIEELNIEYIYESVCCDFNMHVNIKTYKDQILNKAKDIEYKEYKIYQNKTDKDIILTLLKLPSVLSHSLEIKSLNEITDYLYELTSKYNKFYQEFRVLDEENKDLQESWLVLTKLVYDVNTLLLDILSIKVPEKM